MICLLQEILFPEADKLSRMWSSGPESVLGIYGPSPESLGQGTLDSNTSTTRHNLIRRPSRNPRFSTIANQKTSEVMRDRPLHVRTGTATGTAIRFILGFVVGTPGFEPGTP